MFYLLYYSVFDWLRFLHIFLYQYILWYSFCIYRNNPILPFGFRVPSRDSQLVLYRWLFVLSYVLQGALFSSLLIRVTKETDFWAINTACDVILAFIFAVYFRNLHRQKVSYLVAEKIWNMLIIFCIVCLLFLSCSSDVFCLFLIFFNSFFIFFFILF